MQKVNGGNQWYSSFQESQEQHEKACNWERVRDSAA